MKRLGLFLLLLALTVGSSSASADWRWAKPHLRKHAVAYLCDNTKCGRQARLKEKRRVKHLVERYNKRRRHEWKHWTRLYIPTCTWYGESGYGPKYVRYRYTLPNSSGSGAFGKYQFMSSTYHDVAKYHDWSPLDQEIAGHREYWKNGTGPWTNC